MTLKRSITRGPLVLLFCGIAIYLLTVTWSKGRRGHIVFPQNPRETGTLIVIAQGDRFEFGRTGALEVNPYVIKYRTLMGVLSALSIVAVVDTYAGITSAIRRSRFRRSAAAIARGQCPKCNYDLRATPARCTECGTVVTGVLTDP